MLPEKGGKPVFTLANIVRIGSCDEAMCIRFEYLIDCINSNEVIFVEWTDPFYVIQPSVSFSPQQLPPYVAPQKRSSSLLQTSRGGEETFEETSITEEEEEIDDDFNDEPVEVVKPITTTRGKRSRNDNVYEDDDTCRPPNSKRQKSSEDNGQTRGKASSPSSFAGRPDTTLRPGELRQRYSAADFFDKYWPELTVIPPDNITALENQILDLTDQGLLVPASLKNRLRQLWDAFLPKK